ncbi:hypothetical protein BDM02DRAFT_3112969 [Thelephora ganbajun]|uniref:Uncharacterized protein n=1 Tax=Thelephora ganbajun TaxID=370292 RepID=A0ACB6ZK66_THEGA|nr:hypothetical protein BDM02DRAFT_3112969 [Thelephora ganbajun]
MSLDQSSWCPRSSDGAPVLQTRLRVLRGCNRHAQHHRILIEVIPDLFDPSWQPHLLASTSSLHAFITFLRKSSAFTKLGVPFHLNPNPPPPSDPRPP